MDYVIRKKSTMDLMVERNLINYQIAYTDGAALQKYADPGDYLEISFDESNDTLQYAQYVMEGSVYTALYYNYGTWYDFRESTPGKYTGYYNIDPLGDDDGINYYLSCTF